MLKKRWWIDNKINMASGEKLDFSLKRYTQAEKEKVRDKLDKEISMKDNILYNYTIMNSISNQDFIFENYNGILSYNDEEVIIKTKMNNIKLCGKKIYIVYFDDTEIHIKGIIKKIEYVAV